MKKMKKKEKKVTLSSATHKTSQNKRPLIMKGLVNQKDLLMEYNQKLKKK